MFTRKFMFSMIAGFSALGLTTQTHAVELFTFTGLSDGAGFNGGIDAASESGDFTFTSESNTFLQENPTVIFMFRSGGASGETITNTLNVLNTADEVQLFNVNSVDFRTASGTGSWTGLLGGVEQWTLTGPAPADPPATFTLATTGSFSNTIDAIRWDVTDYQDGTFGNTVDNLSINIIPEPASLALLGLGGLAMLGRRRK